jgi:class 3 adenylate cyclase
MSPRRGTSVLVSLLFTDIVGSTEIAAELGDRRWRDLVQRHHAIVRRELKRFGGRELDTAGDGFFARFDRPADAVRCACAISDEVRELGIEIRAGLHVGEAELLEGKVGGIAVNVAARVMAVGKAGEVLVSSTLRDAVAGSGFEFVDHGVHRLKGIEGEWRLHEVMAVDGVRRSLPLGPEEARTRRGFVEGVPVGRGRERIVAAAFGIVVLAFVAVALLTGAFGAEPSPDGDVGFSQEERALAAVVPQALRPSCRRAANLLLDATASVECTSGPYSVTYSRFGSPEAMQDRFDAFAAGAEGAGRVGTDCARDPSARHEYQVNGQVRGEVTCYVEDRAAGLSSASSVIVWTDEELNVLARAVRSDAADLTLYEWWRTEAGPSVTSASPPKEGEAELLNGVFELEITRDQVGSPEEGQADPSWVRTWTLTVSPEEGFDGMPTYREGGEALFAKPNRLILAYGSSVRGLGAVCPALQAVTWRERGRSVVFSDPVGHCRERNLDLLTFEPWVRID